MRNRPPESAQQRSTTTVDNALMRAGGGARSGSMRSLSSIACAVCGVVAFGLSLMTYMDVSLFGFPDGYLTDYQKAAATPLRVGTWLQAGLGLVFLALTFAPISTKARTMSWLASLAGLLLVAVTTRVGVPWYFGTHLGLDNGFGG